MNYREAFHRNFNSFMTEAFTYRNQSIDLLCKLPTNCLSVFDHFVGLAAKGLKLIMLNVLRPTDLVSLVLVLFISKGFSSAVAECFNICFGPVFQPESVTR